MSKELFNKSGGRVLFQNDANVYRKAVCPSSVDGEIDDAILTSGNVTYSATDVSIDFIRFTLCGRICEIANESITVPVNGSTFAVIAQIDNNVLSLVASGNGSPSVTQEDINSNTSGTYERVLVTGTCNGTAITGATLAMGDIYHSGVFCGTTETPPAGVYVNGTLYLQYE